MAVAAVPLPETEWRAALSPMRAVADALERGQAHTPLSDHATGLGEPNDAPLDLLLLCPDPALSQRLLADWLGPQHGSVVVRLSGPADWLEVELQAQGYALETEDGTRRSFDTVAALLDQAMPAQDTSQPWLKVGLPAQTDAGSRPLRLLLPRQFERLVEQPHAWHGRAALVVVLADWHWQPSPAERTVLEHVSAQVPVWWPLSTGAPAPSSPSALASPPPWSRLLPGTAPRLNTRPAEGADWPGAPFLQETSRSDLAKALALGARTDKAEGLLQMLQERLDADLRQVQARQRREAKLIGGPGSSSPTAPRPDSAARAQAEDIKALVTQEFGTLQAALKDSARRAQSKSGPLTQALENTVQSVQPTDLSRTEAGRAVKLALQSELMKQLNQRLHSALQHHLDDDCVLIRDSLEPLRQTVEQRLSAAGVGSRGLGLAAPDTRAISAQMHEALPDDVRYKGELPKRSFMQRLGEGRRIVFVVLMALSLLGGFLNQWLGNINPRQSVLVGLACLAIFIGAVAYTFVSWRREDDELLEREIERVRELLQNDYSRALGEALRDKQSALALLLEDQKKELIQRLDVLLKETQTTQTAAQEQERQEARVRAKALEQRLRDLQGLSQQLSKARLALSDTQQRCRDALRNAVKALEELFTGTSSPGTTSATSSPSAVRRPYTPTSPTRSSP